MYRNYRVWHRGAASYAARNGLDSVVDVAHHVTWGSLPGGTDLTQLPIPVIFGPVGGGQVTSAAGKLLLSGSARWQESIRSTLISHASRAPSVKRTVRSCAMVVVANSATEALAKAAGAKHVERMLCDALDLGAIRSQRRVAQPSVARYLWVGRFLPRKTAHLAVRAFARVHQCNPTSSLRLVGDGPERAALERLVAKLGIREAVTFTGAIPWQQVRGEYSRATCLLFTSVRDTFGAQTLEAMGQGLPVLTLDIHGAGEHLPNDATLRVALRDPRSTINEFANSMIAMHSESDEWRRRSDAALIFARNNTWESRIDQIQSMYEEVLLGRPPKHRIRGNVN